MSRVLLTKKGIRLTFTQTAPRIEWQHPARYATRISQHALNIRACFPIEINYPSLLVRVKAHVDFICPLNNVDSRSLAITRDAVWLYSVISQEIYWISSISVADLETTSR